uniref:Peroxisomal ATPase PEX6 n=1 Tax=Attheya septentrionalis TaxID=420275 RepID=A0A7S2UD17_9STRA|mmetsp:Transcript_20658/g.37359  ORF Transcript_20658/g.37359 Transcript_20658/m.37359 type:complete len:568 (+) Transcript_20658:2-1705(+)
MHIRGLAAFSYQCSLEGGGSNNNNTSTNSVTGSLVDRLNGLRQSLNRARLAAPCVLHISQLQDEFDRVEDLDIRHDQESRFLSCIFESSSSSSSLSNTTTQSIDTNHDLLWRNEHQYLLEQTDSIANEVMCSAPSVIVVVSTSKQLPAGPLLSSLVQAPVHITVPDEAYAKQLWQDDASFEEVKEFVLGLNAREIQFLRRRFVEEMQTHGWKHQKEDELMEYVLKELENSPLGRVGASKLSSSLIPNVRWEDVGGLSHVREEVMDAIELPLAHPEMFAGSQRSGILLFGPPGTGKTLMGKAVATECGLPFLSVKGPELLGSYVGESEANVRAAFLNAREAAASTAAGAAILFFDELDSLAPRRGGVGDGGGVMDRVVSTLLSELDQNDHADGNVFVIGATNRPDLLDPSLLRPGRFDRLVYLGLPTERDDRIKILAAQTRKFKFQDNQSPSTVVAQVIDDIHPSLTGADFSAIASGALMKSLQRLCHQAETEAKRLNNQRHNETKGTPTTITTAQDVLSGWDEDMLEPVVLAQDLLDAAQDVVPSVTEQDLVAYQSLRSQFSVQKSS